MNVEQSTWDQERGWGGAAGGEDADLVLVFGGREAIVDGPWAEARERFGGAGIFGCSGAGEILGTRVLDDRLVFTAIRFGSSRFHSATTGCRELGDSFAAGERLARELDPDGLVHVLVLSEGLAVNGSALIRGLAAGLPDDVGVTGGLSGDGARFEETWLVVDGVPRRHSVTALGLYGEDLRIGCGTFGGWDSFGPERLVTRAEGSVLFELDGRSALELYRRYLGDHAEQLPASGLLFPLSLRLEGSDHPVVRTILGVDDAAGSMTFAGDVPVGSRARLMKANFDRLIDGAMQAASRSSESIGRERPDLAILISCVGRRLVLKQRVEEELEAVEEVLGSATAMTGFYSYGEISPFTPDARCELHNQTMTITTLSER